MILFIVDLGFGYPTLTSQLLTAPPCVISSLFVLLSGYLTDRMKYRTPLLLIGFAVMTLGYILLLIVHDPWGKEIKQGERKERDLG